ncbi:MAG: PDZ domain-containing protein [Planctomycetota bacterium]|jgi:membrane-associated protease RseP (regulator of RpoE activity)
MGVCTNCHTVIKPGVPLARLAPVAAAPSPAFRPAQWTPAAQVWPCPRPVWRNAAAPVTTTGTVRPTLVKAFGIEVRQPPGAGAEVTGVMGNSPAWNAGLRAGDVVIGFNGSRVGSAQQFQQLASLAAPETNASIHILRNGRTRDLSIMVGEGEMEGFTPIQRM